MVAMKKTHTIVSGAETAAIGASTVATEGSTAAIHANKAALMGHPVMAILVAVLTVVVTAITAINAAMEANTKKLKENAEEARKNSEETRKLAEANKELLTSYENLVQEFKETGEEKEQLVDTTTELINKYNIENGHLDLLNKNYDSLIKKIRQERKEELELNKVRAKIAANATGKEMANAMEAGAGMVKDGKYKHTFSSNSASLVKNVLSNNNYSNLNFNNGQISWAVDTNDPAAMYSFYLELQDSITKLTTEANEYGIDVTTIDYYKEVMKELEQGAETYANLETEMKTMFDADKEILAIST
jgi:hypothetical protein